MKARTLLAISLAAAILIAFALRAVRENTQASEALAAEAGRRVELQKKVRRIELRVQTAQAALAAVEAKLQAARADDEASKVKPASAATPSGPARERKMSPRTIVANTPSLMTEYARNFRASLDWDYGGMFKALHLSPEQIEKFKDIEVWLMETQMDLQAAVESQRIDPNSAEYKKLFSDYNRTRSEKKAEFFGPMMGQYFEYVWTESARFYPRQLAWTGIYTGENVIADQVERAADVLIANSKRRVGNPENPGSYYGVEWHTVNWPAAREKLNGVLSPSQIETLGLFIEWDARQPKVEALVKRLTAQFKGDLPKK